MLRPDEKEAIRDHLRKVLASSEFARSDRAAAFLRYVVLNALDDELESIKERSIGIAVFDRSPDWDPKLDTTVRTEARRVRKKLADFYSSAAGEGEAIRINVPVGSYIPQFSFNAPIVGSFPVANVEPEVSQTNRPVTRMAWPWRHWVVGFCLMAAVAFTIVIMHSRFKVFAKSEHFESVPFTSDYGLAFSPAISPDGQQIAYVGDGDASEYRIYTKALDGGSPRRVTSASTSELDPAWSPDGQQLAFLRVQTTGTDVVVRHLADGTEHLAGSIATQNGDWTSDPGPLIGNPGPAWTSDGRGLIVGDGPPDSSNTGLFRIELADGSRRQLTNTDGSAKDFLPKMSPNGRSLAFVRAISHGVSDIFILDLQTNALRRLTSEAKSINGLGWSQDGGRLVFSSNREGAFQLWAINLADANIRKLDTDATTAIDPQLAPNASWMAYVATTQNWNIYSVALNNLSSIRPARFIASSGRNHTARYSPDGRHVAFVSDRSGTWEIWLCSVVCSEPQKLTNFQGPWIGGLSWSRDSQEIAFDARLGRNSAIYRLSLAHPIATLIERNKFEERMPSWSLDGKFLYFDSDRDGSVSIWKHDLASGAVKKIAHGFYAREIDSQGTMILGESDGTLWRMRKDAVPVRISPDAIANPILAWTTLGSTLYYCTLDSDSNLRVMEVSGDKVETMARLPLRLPRTISNVEMTPDGRSLLLTVVDHSSSNIYRRLGTLPQD
jgi:Tol biopolymer transport system component